MGHPVRIVGLGQEAVEAIESPRPDEVLPGLGMPRLNGDEAAHRIRKPPYREDGRLAASVRSHRTTPREITEVEAEIRRVQAGVRPTIHQHPLEPFSPAS